MALSDLSDFSPRQRGQYSNVAVSVLHSRARMVALALAGDDLELAHLELAQLLMSSVAAYELEFDKRDILKPYDHDVGFVLNSHFLYYLKAFPPQAGGDMGTLLRNLIQIKRSMPKQKSE